MPYDRGHVIISRNGWTCEECGLPVTGATDIMGAPVIEGDAIKHVVDEIKETEDIILNFAALVDLEYCEQEKDDCYLTNTISAIHLFNLAKDRNIPYAFISTAGIFGNDKEFYTEEDQPHPLSTYGKSKYYVEQSLLNQNYPKYWIFRAGWMMGGGPEKDKKFVNKIMK